MRLCAFLSFFAVVATAQPYSPSHVFAHNDYVRAMPFFTAYNLRVGYIEADVFLRDGNLMVAHQPNEITEGRDLRTLYLEPLLKKIEKNGGRAYPGAEDTLTLMIDIKTEGSPTLLAITKLLNRYPALTSCETLQVMISGNVPDPVTWHEYPAYISFDGRPGIDYTEDQLQRISMISTSFRNHSRWDGRGPISAEDRRKIFALMLDAHEKGKKFRFWATPDFADSWKTLMDLNMDVIVTDDVVSLVNMIKASR